MVRIEDVGSLARAKRLGAGLSLRDAAQQIGISFNTLHRAENGQEVVGRAVSRLCRWLGLGLYPVETVEPAGDDLAEACALLARSQRIPPDVAVALQHLVIAVAAPLLHHHAHQNEGVMVDECSVRR